MRHGLASFWVHSEPKDGMAFAMPSAKVIGTY
jgi:hypothetical protein